MAVRFSREVYEGESVRLNFLVRDASGWAEERVEIKYPLTAK